MEYYITKHNDGSYTIGKFDGQDHVATYTVKGKSCDCMAGSKRGACKHIGMIAEWKEGYYYEQVGKNLYLQLFNSEAAKDSEI